MRKAIYRNLPWPVKPVTKIIYNKMELVQFSRLKHKCNGMLHASLYKRLYEYASEVGEGNIVEIGAGHGAGTIALGMGVKESGKNSKVIAIERGERGTRARYGNKKENISILEKNVEDYGVEDYVEILPVDLNIESGLPNRVSSSAPFSMMVIDADGKLSRDFQLFYDLLRPGAIIVIDDYSPKRKYCTPSEINPLGGGKPYRTFSYANFLIKEGYITPFKVIDDTLLAIKSLEDSKFEPAGVEEIKTHLEEDREYFFD